MLVLVGMDQKRLSSILLLDFIFAGSNWQVEDIIRATENGNDVSKDSVECMKKGGMGSDVLELEGTNDPLDL